MTEPHPLEALLARTAERVPVGPAPTDLLARGAARARRARTATLASAAAVVVVAGGLTVAAGPGGGDAPGPGTAATGHSSEAAHEPGTRLVGLGRAAVAVPGDWGANDVRCGVPQADTVVVDVTFVDLCAIARPLDVDSVEVTRGEAPFDFEPDRATSVDGVPARRQATTCSETYDDAPLCTGFLRIPSIRVTFRAESSTDAATVDRLLDRVRVLRDQRGVPGYEPILNAAQERSGERYAEALREAGFAPRVVTRGGTRWPAGFVLDVSPGPGTVLDTGSEVVVEVSGDR